MSSAVAVAAESAGEASVKEAPMTTAAAQSSGAPSGVQVRKTDYYIENIWMCFCWRCGSSSSRVLPTLWSVWSEVVDVLRIFSLQPFLLCKRSLRMEMNNILI